MRYIRNLFGFSQGEARGFTIMALLVLLVYGGWFVYRILPSAPYQPQHDQQTLDSLISLLEAGDSSRFLGGSTLADTAGLAPNLLFSFNPNLVSYDSLLLLGFPPYLAKRMLNYRQKGGHFRKKEDLQKLYGLQKDLYVQLEPWIELPKRPVQSPSYPERTNFPFRDRQPAEKSTREPARQFDLNQADSLQLLSVRGIGPVLSSRILKFRESLGGFVRAEQLREVWGLPPEAADALLERSFVALEEVRKLPLNTADVAELARHPYISRKQAEAIVAYRLQHGPFARAESLLQLHILDESFVNKLAPYLRF